ncbi:MAG: hypothetical protein QW036_04455 [Zestosphaera sp.]
MPLNLNLENAYAAGVINSSARNTVAPDTKELKINEFLKSTSLMTDKKLSKVKYEISNDKVGSLENAVRKM